MKILVIASTIDLKHRLGCTPSWWQLLKALRDLGHEIISIPYLGKPVETLWWRTYENPCAMESLAYNFYLESKIKSGKSPGKNDALTPVTSLLLKRYIRPKWESHIRMVLEKEKDVDFVLFMNVPMNHISGIPGKIRDEYRIPVVYYDGDMPTILPQHTVKRGFKFNYYQGADLSEYDVFFTNSKGVMADLVQLGARNVTPLYYAVDPDIFRPVKAEQDIDVFFYGHGNELREEWMTKMITVPSRVMPSGTFLLAGKGFSIDFGKASVIDDLPMSSLARYCCRSKINLNITRSSHTSIYASSTARLFELAAYGSCIVSQPYSGIEEWFDVGKELIVVNSEREAIEAYQWLLSSPADRQNIGARARARMLKEHTYSNRALTVLNAVKACANVRGSPAGATAAAGVS